MDKNHSFLVCPQPVKEMNSSKHIPLNFHHPQTHLFFADEAFITNYVDVPILLFYLTSLYFSEEDSNGNA